MWSHWINAESCADGISLFFTHRQYVISLDQCRIVCSWNLPMFHSQRVCDLIESMQNRVLMESPYFSPTACTWSRWIDAQLCAHGISPFFTHRTYMISLDQCRIMFSWNLPVFHPQEVRDQCRIVCSWHLPVFHPQEVRDLVGSMQNRVLIESPMFHPQRVCDLVGSMQNCVLMESPCFSPTESTWSCWINA